MFTGIVKSTGKVASVNVSGSGKKISIATAYEHPWQLGNSVAVNGICLTICDTGNNLLTFELSEETLAKTTAADWTSGDSVNIEPALRVGDELGGHWVTGHIDGIGSITSIQQEPDELGMRLVFTAPDELMQFIAAKGGITIDGVSLTVNQVTADTIAVVIIPWTKQNTIFSVATVGILVNIEVDIIARHIAKLVNKDC
ncbi:MAG: riboflavin synthase [Gammaproteobacteria bacterium]|nr:riboflavin synthase [Gammaproteobacteria bacterium]